MAGERSVDELLGESAELMSEVVKVHPQHPVTAAPTDHYSHPTGITAIEVIEVFPFNIANAMKYLWRVGMAPRVGEVGDDRDLEKAVWYIQREIERRREP